ncbi:MAG: flagellar biosynthesis protein [Roseibium sp.]
MPKVGNYVQRDYHSKFSSKRSSKWTNYNKGWGAKRSSSIQKSQALRTQLSNSVTTINTQMVQQQALSTMQNRYSPQATYASPTAIGARINMSI